MVPSNRRISKVEENEGFHINDGAGENSEEEMDDSAIDGDGSNEDLILKEQLRTCFGAPEKSRTPVQWMTIWLSLRIKADLQVPTCIKFGQLLLCSPGGKVRAKAARQKGYDYFVSAQDVIQYLIKDLKIVLNKSSVAESTENSSLSRPKRKTAARASLRQQKAKRLKTNKVQSRAGSKGQSAKASAKKKKAVAVEPVVSGKKKADSKTPPKKTSNGIGHLMVRIHQQKKKKKAATQVEDEISAGSSTPFQN